MGTGFLTPKTVGGMTLFVVTLPGFTKADSIALR